MLHLLNNIIGKFVARPKSVIGVGISRKYIYTVKAVIIKGKWRVQEIKKLNLPFRMFEGIPTEEIRHSFSRYIDELCSDVKNSSIPIQIAIPDPAVSLRVFELDVLPKTHKERLALVHWLFSKESRNLDQVAECRYQSLGTDNGKHLLFALSVNQEWLHCIEDAFRIVGLNSTVIDMAACYRFNQLHCDLSLSVCDAVLVALDLDFWSISIGDEQGRLRFIRAHWRSDYDEIQGNNQYHDLIFEIERVTRAYVHGSPHRLVKNIYITGGASDVACLGDLLDQRMKTQCIRLVDGESFLVDPNVLQVDMDEAGVTLAAAMLR